MTIFITGNSRSGTTMMSRILGNHREVMTFQELHFFDEVLPSGKMDAKTDPISGARIFATLCAIQRNGYFGSRNISPFITEATKVLENNPGISFAVVYKNFLEYETQKNGKTIPCEQTPQNIFYLEDIFRNFPTSKIIIMVRDPREVLLSQKYKWKRRILSGGKIPYWESLRSRINYHPVMISRIWKSVMQTALKYKNHPSVMFVKYEDLIAAPEAIAQNVCAFTGIDYLPELLNIPIVGSSNFSDSEKQTGIDTTKTGQWQKGGLSAAEIQICQEVNGELMKKFGYEKLQITPGKLTMACHVISLPFSLGLALLFNLRRLKHPGKIIKRFSS